MSMTFWNVPFGFPPTAGSATITDSVINSKQVNDSRGHEIEFRTPSLWGLLHGIPA